MWSLVVLFLNWALSSFYWFWYREIGVFVKWLSRCRFRCYCCRTVNLSRIKLRALNWKGFRPLLSLCNCLLMPSFSLSGCACVLQGCCLTLWCDYLTQVCLIFLWRKWEILIQGPRSRLKWSSAQIRQQLHSQWWCTAIGLGRIEFFILKMRPELSASGCVGCYRSRRTWIPERTGNWGWNESPRVALALVDIVFIRERTVGTQVRARLSCMCGWESVPEQHINALKFR